MQACSDDILYRIFGELDIGDATRFSSLPSRNCTAGSTSENEDLSSGSNSNNHAHTGLDEHAWRTRALSTWPTETVRLCPPSPYATYRELVLDDNRHGIDWRVPLQRCASLYKYNRDHAYYECKLLHLEWNRLNDTLSVYFDARGETDLRHPMQSSLIVTTPVRDGQPLSSKHVLFSLQANSAQLLSSTEAHYKGCLTFDGCGTIGHRLNHEICAADQEALQQSGMELWFVYANQLPFSALQVPWLPASSSLPSQRPWDSHNEAAKPLVAALATKSEVVVPGATLRMLRDEGRADTAARWSDLPESVAQRGLWGH